MKLSLRSLFLAVGLTALLSSTLAQTVEFRATINGAQETPATGSTSTGSAVMIYDVAKNTFDLLVTLNNFPGPLTGSHIHEAPAGAAGAVVTSLGAEAAYARNGNTLAATFRGIAHGGDKLKLLQNGAYVNFHSAVFPGGEIRGQLIAQPKRLTAVIDVAQSQAPNPTQPINSKAFGAALLTYNSGTNKITFSINLFGFTNTLTNSHFHEAAPGVSGAVTHGIGGAALYNVAGGFISKTFADQTYLGDPIKLLTGGAYLNFHSNAYPGGEVRGQVIASEELPSSRLANASARGVAGAGDQALIVGLVVTGPEPVAATIAVRGPSLTRFGVGGALADPTVTLFDVRGLTLATNDNNTLVLPAVVPPVYDPKDAALRVILPPGLYTAQVGSAVSGATGVALVEATEDRNFSF